MKFVRKILNTRGNSIRSTAEINLFHVPLQRYTYPAPYPSAAMRAGDRYTRCLFLRTSPDSVPRRLVSVPRNKLLAHITLPHYCSAMHFRNPRRTFLRNCIRTSVSFCDSDGWVDSLPPRDKSYSIARASNQTSIVIFLIGNLCICRRVWLEGTWETPETNQTIHITGDHITDANLNTNTCHA